MFASKPKAPAPPPPPPVDNSAEVDAARKAELQRRAAQGRASTILTKENEIGEAATAKKKLLGA
jgi:hypothetical protein